MIASIMLAVKVKDDKGKNENNPVSKSWCAVWECHTINAGYVSCAQLKHNQSSH